MDEIKRNCTNSWEMACEWFVNGGPRLLETERIAGGADHALSSCLSSFAKLDTAYCFQLI